MENLEFKGTKGEWYYNQKTPRTFIIGSDQHYRDKIIKVWSDDCISNKCSLDEAESNAKLIAAAPETIKELIKSTEVLEELLKIRISGGRQFGKTMLFNQIKSNYKTIEKALK